MIGPDLVAALAILLGDQAASVIFELAGAGQAA